MSNISPESQNLGIVTFDQPETLFAQRVQPIGFEAWNAALVGLRVRGDVIAVYDPPETPIDRRMNYLYEHMQKKAGEGRFTGVLAMVGGSAVGFGWASELPRYPWHKRINRGEDPRSHRSEVKIEDINVLPDFQGRGIGTVMLSELLSHYGPYHHPRADVPAELGQAVEWFQNRGFAPVGGYESHVFGPAPKVAKVTKLKAPGVDLVKRDLAPRLSEIGPYKHIDIYGDEIADQAA